MIKQTYWVCETCGQVFNNELDCVECEWEHQFELVKDDLLLYDGDGVLFTLASDLPLEHVQFVKVRSEMAALVCQRLFEEENGIENPAEHWKGQENLFYWTGAVWCSWNEEMSYLLTMKERFNLKTT